MDYEDDQPFPMRLSPPKGGEVGYVPAAPDRGPHICLRAANSVPTALPEAAAFYGEALGLRVIPASLEPTFRPRLGDWPANATSSSSTIERWWRAEPNAAICIATGSSGGVFVVDVDQKHGVDGLQSLRQLEDEYGGLPETWRSETPSGGCHLWFRCPPNSRVRNRVGLRPGLDIRGDNGLVVAPPSSKLGGRYSWARSPSETDLAEAPQWLLELIGATDRDEPSPVSTTMLFESRDQIAKYLEAVVRGECASVTTAVEGGRNDQLFRSSARLGEFVGAGVLLREFAEARLADAAYSAGLSHSEIRRTIQSGLDRGVAQPLRIGLRK